jgi:hypothetical protein
VDPIWDFLGGLPHVAYSKSKLDAPIYWRCKSREEHFIPGLPIHRDINKAVASANRYRILTQK